MCFCDLKIELVNQVVDINKAWCWLKRFHNWWFNGDRNGLTMDWFFVLFKIKNNDTLQPIRCFKPIDNGSGKNTWVWFGVGLTNRATRRVKLAMNVSVFEIEVQKIASVGGFLQFCCWLFHKKDLRLSNPRNSVSRGGIYILLHKCIMLNKLHCTLVVYCN